MSDLLEQSSRLRIVRLISLMPGIHIRQLHRLLGLSFNSTRYHVSKLSSSGKLVCEKEGGYLRLYPPGLEEKEKRVYSVLRNKTFRIILVALIQTSSLTQKEICDRTALAKSSVCVHIHKLVDFDLVDIQHLHASEIMSYGVKNPEYLLPMLSKANKLGDSRKIQIWLDTPTDRYEQLWEL